MSNKCSVVFTAKSIERILEEGGTSSWRLDRNHARQCEYVVCTRNAHADWVEGPEAHHSAFLVGRVSDVVPCLPTAENKEAAENRYLIQFSKFARVNFPEIWKGDRNPVKYSTLEDLGIDPSALKWEAMPEQTEKKNTVPKTLSSLGLTLAEAKKGLALTFGVPPDAIEITIRG